MFAEITGDELKARFFEIMKRVCQGESFTIAVEGRTVAEIRPSAKHGPDEETTKVLEELCSPRFEGPPTKRFGNGSGRANPRFRRWSCQDIGSYDRP